MSLDLNDPKLTAYALGELDAAEQAAVETELDRTPAARRVVQDIRETATLLAAELSKEPCPALSELDRLTIETQSQSAIKTVARFSWTPVAIAAALLLAVLVPMFLHIRSNVQVAQHAASNQDTDATSSATQPEKSPRKQPGDPGDYMAQSGPDGTDPNSAADSAAGVEMPANHDPAHSGEAKEPSGVAAADQDKPADAAKPKKASVAIDRSNPRLPTIDDVTWIDRLVREKWEEAEIKPSAAASDGEFIRRAYLDIVGHTPSADEAKEYIDSKDKEKKVKLVRKLLASEDYSKYWANNWSNLLIGRRPGRNISRASMLKYLRDSFAENKPWNKMVYELVTATGGSTPKSLEKGVAFNGATNYLLSHMNDQKVPATSFTTRLFLGMQVQCTQCHDHPFNDRKQESFWGVYAFFQKMQRQDHNDLSDTGQQIFLFADLHDQPLEQGADLFVQYDKRNAFVEVTPPRWIDGTKILEGTPDLNLRQRLAQYIIDPDNKYFAQAIVNRMWAHFLGRGVVHPLDDIGEHNPASNPELIERLAQHFQESNYDLKRLIAWITLSTPYALSSQANASNKEDDALFSHFALKQLSPEQFFDSLMVASKANRVGSAGWEDADKKRDELLRQFTTVFNNDENTEADSFNGTIPQALLLMNGDLMAKAISKDKGSHLRESVDEINAGIAKKKVKSIDQALVVLLDDLYLAALSRHPNQKEKNLAMELLRATVAQSKDKDPIEAYQDIFWALLNSSEFVLNH